MHYGYNSSTPEAKERYNSKHERNLVPLLEEYEKNPKNKTTLLHLLNQYFASGDLEEAGKYLDEGLAIATEPTDIFYHIYHEKLGKLYQYLKKHEEAVATFEKYFANIKLKYEVTVDIKRHYADALVVLKQYEKAAQIFEEIIDIINNKHKRPLDPHASKFISLVGLTPKAKDHASHYALICYSHIGNFDKAPLFSNKEGDIEKQKDAYTLFIAACKKDDNTESAYKMYEHAVKKYGFGSPVYNYIVAIFKSAYGSLAKIAMMHNIPPDDYINNLQQTTQETINEITKDLKNVDILLNYVFDNNFLLDNPNTKVTNILSLVAYTFLENRGLYTKVRLDLFIAHVLVRNEYLKFALPEGSYTNDNIANLSQQDAFILAASQAFDHTGDEMLNMLLKAVDYCPQWSHLTNLAVRQLKEDMQANAEVEG
jgi:tetratricopeptide (TPR) repeat protein